MFVDLLWLCLEQKPGTAHIEKGRKRETKRKNKEKKKGKAVWLATTQFGSLVDCLNVVLVICFPG